MKIIPNYCAVKDGVLPEWKVQKVKPFRGLLKKFEYAIVDICISTYGELIIIFKKNKVTYKFRFGFDTITDSYKHEFYFYKNNIIEGWQSTRWTSDGGVDNTLKCLKRRLVQLSKG